MHALNTFVRVIAGMHVAAMLRWTSGLSLVLIANWPIRLKTVGAGSRSRVVSDLPWTLDAYLSGKTGCGVAAPNNGAMMCRGCRGSLEWQQVSIARWIGPTVDSRRVFVG